MAAAVERHAVVAAGARGVELLGQWLEQGDAAGDDDRWLMAQGLAQLERWDTAAKWVDRARGEGNVANDRYLQLAASIYQRAGREDQALASLDALLAGAEVSADTWRRAAGLAQRLDQPGRAAAIWEAGWRRGALQGEAALRQLIQLHMAGGTPARAAEHLERALADGRLQESLANRRLLAQAWSAARNRDAALQAWRAVSERSQESEDWRQLGELAYAWGRWGTAIEALRREMSDAEGTAQGFREQLLDTFEGQKTLLRGTLQTFAVVLGEPLLDHRQQFGRIMHGQLSPRLHSIILSRGSKQIE